MSEPMFWIGDAGKGLPTGPLGPPDWTPLGYTSLDDVLAADPIDEEPIQLVTEKSITYTFDIGTPPREMIELLWGFDLVALYDTVRDWVAGRFNWVHPAMVRWP